METQKGRDTVQVSDSWRVAVVAKYLGPTTHRGSRIRVRSAQPGGESLTVSWDDALNSDENYAQAVHAFLIKMGWGGRWSMGGTDTGRIATWVGWAE